jgi:hypothetical protein
MHPRRAQGRASPSIVTLLGVFILLLLVVRMTYMVVINHSIALVPPKLPFDQPRLFKRWINPGRRAATARATAPSQPPPSVAPTATPTSALRTHSPTHRLRVKISDPTGQTCNQVLSLAAALAMTKARNWHLVLSGSWEYLVRTELDLAQLHRWVRPGVVSFGHAPHARELDAWWCRVCAQRYYLAAIRDGIRPHPALRKQGQQTIEMLKARGAREIISVHNRAFEGPGYCLKRAQESDTYCHHSAKDRGDATICACVCVLWVALTADRTNQIAPT